MLWQSEVEYDGLGISSAQKLRRGFALANGGNKLKRTSLLRWLSGYRQSTVQRLWLIAVSPLREGSRKIHRVTQ